MTERHQAELLAAGSFFLRRAVLLLGLLHAFASPVAAAEEHWRDAEINEAEQFLREHFPNRKGGMVIGLCDRNGSRIIGAGGLDDCTGREVDGDTIFELGSVTKVFTALLALESAWRGEVGLDDPVSNFLPPGVRMPDFEDKKITLRNLAAQDSGLPFHAGDYNDWEVKGMKLADVKRAFDAFTATDLYSFLPACRLTQAPGTSFEYSNVGMGLLGHAFELKTGKDYETLVVERICERLGMNSTRIALRPDLAKRMSRGHDIDGTQMEPMRLQVMAGAGALKSSANDMVKFLAANLGFTQTDLNPLLVRMQTSLHEGAPRFGRTAMPWFDEGVYQPPGSDLLGHGGGGFGWLAFAGFDLKQRRAVVVLTNQMNVRASGVGWTLLQGMPLSRENVTHLVREIVGLGFGFDAADSAKLPRITTVYPRSPAGEAGLKTGWLIRSIQGTPLIGKSSQECLALIKGPEGGTVRLETFDPDRNERQVLDLVRRKFITSSERTP